MTNYATTGLIHITTFAQTVHAYFGVSVGSHSRILSVHDSPKYAWQTSTYAIANYSV